MDSERVNAHNTMSINFPNMYLNMALKFVNKHTHLTPSLFFMGNVIDPAPYSDISVSSTQVFSAPSGPC